jgi:hypothetical protein
LGEDDTLFVGVTVWVGGATVVTLVVVGKVAVLAAVVEGVGVVVGGATV